MTAKRKAKGKAAAKGKGRLRKRKASSSEEDHNNTDIDDAEAFDKGSLQRVVSYNFNELMADPIFNHPEFVHRIDPSELTMEYYEKTGLEHPLHFRCDPKLIGMTVPDKSFSVDDVLRLVGGNRIIEVVEVKNQGSVKMPLKQFIDFYKSPPEKRETLYNVLSLEFSLTELEDYVQSPSLVRQIDWVGQKWPDALRQRWIAFNGRDKKLYTPHHTFPKVQNYCLMSVANCYTDFHIDFSGTSVWYHVLKGRKVFWLIPPTQTNFLLYQEFIQSIGDSSFFGKSVEKCHMAILEPGDTMLIPSGWIHAVYTPDDSLVFGGNFLHSMSCRMQIRVYQCENRLNITRKFRLPYNEELIFFVIADYVKLWTNREYVRPFRIQDARMDYVGQKWKEAGGHKKPIEYSDFANGVELANEEDFPAETNADEKQIKVIAMHAENSVYSRPHNTKPALVDSCLDAEEDEEGVADEESAAENDEERRDAEIEALRNSNPLIFYKNSKHDFVRNKCVPDHKLGIGHEPPLEFNQAELDKISMKMLDELEALGTYIRRKAKVEIAEGICEPASLLNAFLVVLRKRRAQLEGKEFEEKEAPKRKYTRSSLESGHYDDFVVKNEKVAKAEGDGEEGEEEEEEATCSRSSSRFKVEDFPENLLENDEVVKAEPAAPEEGTTAVTRRNSRQAAEKANAAIKEEIEEMETPSEQIDEEESEMSWRERMEREERSRERASETKEIKKEKKPKLSREDRKELKAKELERKRKSSSLDAALIAAHGHAKSKKKKPEKPQFVGGLPMAPIQEEPVVANPYNYDPKMEMIKLGTGQLKSAYRKSKNNIELRIEKNLYKLEPKRSSAEDGEEGEEENGREEETLGDESIEKTENENCETKTSKNAEPISIDIFPTSSTASAKKSKPTTSTTPIEKSEKRKSSKPSTSSPVLFSPGGNGSSVKERKKSPVPTARKATYMPAVSRQDRMIAEAPTSPVTPATKRHSISDVKTPPTQSPMFTPRTPSTDVPYTPTAPMFRNSIRASMEGSGQSGTDSPIDVVNDHVEFDTTRDFTDSPTLHEITSPPGLVIPNGRKISDDAIGKGPKMKIPSLTAISQLKVLIEKLNKLNEDE